MKIISLSLNSKEIDRAIKEVKAYRKEFLSKVRTLNERLAELGAAVARVEFENALYAGTNDVQVRTEVYDGGAKIIAEGQAVLFIEFGSGISYPEHPQAREFDFRHGTYGQGKGKQPKGWVYKGEQGNAGIPVTAKNGQAKDGVYRTKGNAPTMGMYMAVREIEQRINQIAREVFG